MSAHNPLRRRALLTVSALFGVLCAGCPAQEPAAIFPTQPQIAALQTQSGWGGFRSVCEKDVKLKPQVFGDFTPAGHYESKGKSDNAQQELRAESFAIYHLGVCYQISHERRYADTAESLLNGWTSVTRIGSLQGEDEFNFFASYALLSAYALKSDPAWNSAAFTDFVQARLVPAIHAKLENNHGNWGVLFEVAIGAYLHDPKLIQAARERWLSLMSSQVAEDGSLPREICRSDTTNWCDGPTKGINGLSYEHWTLTPTAIAAEVFKNLGMEVYTTPEGKLLHKAYHKAAAWTLAPETFPFYAANHGHLNNVRGAAYFYLLQTVFPDPAADAVLRSAEGVKGDELNLRALYAHTPAK